MSAAPLRVGRAAKPLHECIRAGGLAAVEPRAVADAVRTRMVSEETVDGHAWQRREGADYWGDGFNTGVQGVYRHLLG
jgi:hypothetical protein